MGHSLLIHTKGEPDRRALMIAERLVPDPPYHVVVLDLPPGALEGEWETVARLLADRPGAVRLVYGRREREDVQAVGQRLADRLGRPVLAPDGETLPAPGGKLFIPSEHGAGWLCFRPGREVERDSRRFPKTRWEFSAPDRPLEVSARAVAEPMPSGVWVRSAADRRLNTHRQRLMQVLPVHPDILTIVIGSPDAPRVPLEDVARVWDSVLPNVRPLARFVHYGSVDLPDGLTLGQALADTLQQQVVLYGGVPVQPTVGFNPPEIRVVRADGWLSGPPFVSELSYLPSTDGERPAPPALHGLRAPMAGLRELSYGVYDYAPDAVLEIVQSGLWLRPPEEPADGDDVRCIPAEPGSPLLLFDRDTGTAESTERMRSLAEDVMWHLAPEIRCSYRLAPSDDAESVRASVVRPPAEAESWGTAAHPVTTVAPGTVRRAAARRAGAGADSGSEGGGSGHTTTASAVGGDGDMSEGGSAAALMPTAPPSGVRPSVESDSDSDSGGSGPGTGAGPEPVEEHGTDAVGTGAGVRAPDGVGSGAAGSGAAGSGLASSGAVHLGAAGSGTAGSAAEPGSVVDTGDSGLRGSGQSLPSGVRALMESGPDEQEAGTGPESGGAGGAEVGEGEGAGGGASVRGAGAREEAGVGSGEPPAGAGRVGAPAGEPPAGAAHSGAPRPVRPAVPRIRLESGAPDVPEPIPTGAGAPAGRSPEPGAHPVGLARPDAPEQAVRPAGAVAPVAGPGGQEPSVAAPAPPVRSPAVRVQPVPKAAACAVPPERELEQERAWVRRTLSGQYNAVESTVSGVLAESPGLRGGAGADTSDILTELVAVRLYLVGDSRGLDAAVRGATPGPHVPLARCVASGLRRLPSYRGPALLHARLGDAERAWYREGRLATEWAFCAARTDPSTGPEGSTDLLIWSLTARRTNLIDPGVRDRVLFLPGTSFKVLRVHTGDRHAVLLRELSPSEIAEDGRVAPGRTPLDEIALNGLEQTLKILNEAGTGAASKPPAGSLGDPPGLVLPARGPKPRTTAGQTRRRKAAKK